MKSRVVGALAALALSLTSCQSQPVARQSVPGLSLDRVPTSLLRPAVMDWQTQRINGPTIAPARAEVHARRVQAYTAPAGWTTAGSAVTGFTGVPAGDYVPNGPSAVYGTSGTPASCFDKVFYLTATGKLLKVAKDQSTKATVDLGTAHSRTYVTLSPAGGRAYLLSDNGTFSIVDTNLMTKQTVGAAASSGNQGLAPVLDPYVSQPDDSYDEVYVPFSNGTIRRYAVKGTPPVATLKGTYTPAGALKANPIVLGGVIYVGDQSGNFVRYDANTSTTLSTTALVYPINAAPALDLDAAGNVSDAFVNAGTRCYWINFASGTVTGSRALYLDENDNKRSGTLSQWNYSGASSKYWLVPTQALSINLDTGAPLAGADASGYKTTAYLCPADCNTRAGGTRDEGGPVYAYMRFDVLNSPLPGTAVVNGMKLWMNTVNSVVRQLRPYHIFNTSPTLTTGGLWTSANMTQANRPAMGSALGTWSGSTIGLSTTPQNRVLFDPNVWHPWTVTTPPATLGSNYAIGVYNDANDEPMWPEVVNPEDNGNAAQKSQRYGPQFYWDPTNTSTFSYVTTSAVTAPSGIPGIGTDRRPLLEVSAAAKALPSGSLSSPPIVDVYNGRKFVYVVNGNTVFGLDFSSTANFADAAGTATRFNVTRTGTKGVGNYSPTFPYATGTNGAVANLYVVENKTAPLMTFDASALFVLDRYPADANTTPNGYVYALNRIGLPLRTDNAIGYSNYQEFGTTGTPITGAREAGSYMVIDYFSYNLSTGAVHFGLPGTTAGGTGNVYRLNQ